MIDVEGQGRPSPCDVVVDVKGLVKFARPFFCAIGFIDDCRRIDRALVMLPLPSETACRSRFRLLCTLHRAGKRISTVRVRGFDLVV